MLRWCGWTNEIHISLSGRCSCFGVFISSFFEKQEFENPSKTSVDI